MPTGIESFEMLVRGPNYDGYRVALTHHETLNELAGLGHYLAKLAGRRPDFSMGWEPKPESSLIGGRSYYRTTIGRIVDIRVPAMPVLSVLTQPLEDGDRERVVGLIGHDMDKVEHTIRLGNDEQFIHYQVDGANSRIPVKPVESMVVGSRGVAETHSEVRSKVYGVGQAIMTQINYLEWLLEDAAEASEQLS